jgi:hypothetical protein
MLKKPTFVANKLVYNTQKAWLVVGKSKHLVTSLITHESPFSKIFRIINLGDQPQPAKLPVKL